MPTVFEMVLDDSRPAGKAVASATFWPGDQRLGLCVTYSDPPGREAARPIRVSVGEFGQDGVQSFNETKDAAKEVAASYPEAWAEFCARLPEVLLAAIVMES